MTVADLVTPHFVDRVAVLEKCRYFTTCQIWPLRTRADPEAWLENFRDDELPHAIQLLNSVLLFQTPFIDRLFYSAFQSLSRFLFKPGDSLTIAQSRWRTFVDSVLLTHVTGEDPSTTDSGYTFARKAKKVLGIDESRILPPDEVLKRLVNSGPQPVVFVDDFVGSGNQFVTSWHREYSIGPGSRLSFAKAAATGSGPFAYTPLICTSQGYAVIAQDCPVVKIQAAHVLDPRYSAIHPQSVIWPDSLRSSAHQFLRTVSLRAGVPDSPGSVDHFEGFNSLGLTIAFEDSVPDASLPILRWTANDWKPLLRTLVS
ncbi:MAG: hypothetical protein KF869_08025 [Phycisphaeraceae bacterium]|nr:hypothetical protein [Phycisphaeraceae bacterium]